MLETVVLVTNGYRPDQDYERMATWINILGSPEFIATMNILSMMCSEFCLMALSLLVKKLSLE